MFKRLSLDGWRQFRSIEINFHPRLTVLTGANGAGKTTLLGLISRHLGWGNQYIATPSRRSANSDSMTYSPDLWEIEKLIENVMPPEFQILERNEVLRLSESDRVEYLLQLESYSKTAIETLQSKRRAGGPVTKIGQIEYSSGTVSSIEISPNCSHVYDVQIPNQQSIEGVHVPSHRSASAYQQVQNIPTTPRRRNDVFNNYVNLVRSRFMGGHTQWSPQYYMKETLIALATFGYGNAAVDADSESASLFEDFQRVLAQMLPPTLGFKRLIVRVPEVVLETDTGDFSIDALSGGVSAVIDLAWQIFMFKPSSTRFVVTLDEPENHLHPALQRTILSNLLKAFPDVQFVVATHSPFIVGSVPDSSVYALAYDKTNSVVSHLLDMPNKAGSANDILREVLGVDITIPIWAEDRLRELVAEYSKLAFSREVISDLRVKLAELGLEAHAPRAIANLAAAKDS
jgi:predicted ATPase